MRLSEIQSAFQAAVLAGENGGRGKIIDSVDDSPKTDRSTLFSVYIDAYRLRLTEFVSNDFPILRSHLGDHAFASLVEDYVDAAPSRQRNARWYASRMPEFMSAVRPWGEQTDACDLARFERALANAFDANDARSLTIAVLQEVGLERQPNVAFSFHPSVTILDLLGGTTNRYECLAGGATTSGAADDRESVLFWRVENETYYRQVSEDERLALMEAMQGKRLSDICMLLAFQGNDEDAAGRFAGFLSQWFAGGLITQLTAA
ncbi:MAG TPA: DNA-binding domain-containing protein [Methylocystis sp.]|jgi:hypothetical protein